MLAQNYDAGVQLVDLKRDPHAAVAAINRWAKQETAGRIPEIIKELQPDAGLVLANAIYFNARWALPFKVEMAVGAAPAKEPPPPIVMKIDRPFIFVIRDIKTNALLFVGRVMNPAQ